MFPARVFASHQRLEQEMATLAGFVETAWAAEGRKVPGSKYVMYQGPQYVNG